MRDVPTNCSLMKYTDEKKKKTWNLKIALSQFESSTYLAKLNVDFLK